MKPNRFALILKSAGRPMTATEMFEYQDMFYAETYALHAGMILTTMRLDGWTGSTDQFHAILVNYVAADYVARPTTWPVTIAYLKANNINLCHTLAHSRNYFHALLSQHMLHAKNPAVKRSLNAAGVYVYELA